MRRVKLVSPVNDNIVYGSGDVDDETDTVTFRLDDLPDEMVEFQVVDGPSSPMEILAAALRWNQLSLRNAGDCTPENSHAEADAWDELKRLVWFGRDR
jgi:hypothetical protein